jgi:hypothetical protein
MKQPLLTNLFIAAIFQQGMKIFLISFLLSVCVDKSKINRNERNLVGYEIFDDPEIILNMARVQY